MTLLKSDIPRIEIAPLFGPPGPARDETDAAVRAAAADCGFMTVAGFAGGAAVGPQARRALLRVFALPEADIRRLWRQKFEPRNANIYRGWFPAQTDAVTCKQGIDMGPDVAYGACAVGPGDPLREPTPLPDEADLPGWRAAAAAYYIAMEVIARMLMRSIARGLGLEETVFDDAFRGGISTLRLLHYPLRTQADLAAVADPAVWVEHNGRRAYVGGRAHCDSGFVTLLAQDGVSGLQARGAGAAWTDVPPEEGTLAVNFGRLLERWTGGRIKATEHRVIGTGQERFSVPFFYEPKVDAVISPLPLPGADAFAPFYFGDHLWESVTKFVEFQGMENLRAPHRSAA